MTTNVTVKTHGWPVEIETTDNYADKETVTYETVAPNSERTVYLTSSRSISFKELPLPKAE